MDKTGSCLVITVETVDRTYPESSLIVAEQFYSTVVANAPLIGIVVQEHPKTITVVAVQSVVGGYPDTAVLILTDTVNQTAGEIVGRNKVSRLCRETAKRHNKG